MSPCHLRIHSTTTDTGLTTYPTLIEVALPVVYSIHLFQIK